MIVITFLPLLLKACHFLSYADTCLPLLSFLPKQNLLALMIALDDNNSIFLLILITVINKITITYVFQTALGISL